MLSNFQRLSPKLPKRTRLFRLFNGHRNFTDVFTANLSVIGVIDTYGIELIHPHREGRFNLQIGRKGIPKQRWVVGGKLCLLLNHLGRIVSRDCDTGNVYDGSNFQHLVADVRGRIFVFADVDFAKAVCRPFYLRLCRRGEWNSRRLMETILSMLAVVCHFKKVRHRR